MLKSSDELLGKGTFGNAAYIAVRENGMKIVEKRQKLVNISEKKVRANGGYRKCEAPKSACIEG